MCNTVKQFCVVYETEQHNNSSIRTLWLHAPLRYGWIFLHNTMLIYASSSLSSKLSLPSYSCPLQNIMADRKKKFFIPKTFSCLVYCHVQGVFNVVYPHPELVGPWLFHQEPCLLSLCFPSYWDFLNRPKELRLQDITLPVSQFFSTCRMTLRVFNLIYHSSYCYTEPFEYSLLLWNYSNSYFILLK